VEVPFSKSNGVTKVDCTINSLPLSFVFDTGASDVTLSQVEASFMLKNGYLNHKDFAGEQHYQTADGNIAAGTVINLRKINFGGLELNNVRASVVKNQHAPLLLGQSVLQRLGKIEIDNEKQVIKITKNY
jgi:clan AA aspartic protease (TIGR02281 family)